VAYLDGWQLNVGKKQCKSFYRSFLHCIHPALGCHLSLKLQNIHIWGDCYREVVLLPFFATFFMTHSYRKHLMRSTKPLLWKSEICMVLKHFWKWTINHYEQNINVSIFHICFKGHILHICVTAFLWIKGFLHRNTFVADDSWKIIMENEAVACDEQILHFPQYFQYSLKMTWFFCLYSIQPFQQIIFLWISLKTALNAKGRSYCAYADRAALQCVPNQRSG